MWRPRLPLETSLPLAITKNPGVVACSKGVPSGDSCTTPTLQAGTRVLYVGAKDGSDPNFPLSGVEYLGKVDSVTGGLSVAWDHLGGNTPTDSRNVVGSQLCSPDSMNRRVTYKGAQGPLSIYFPDARASYSGSLKTRFPGNKAEVYWEHLSDVVVVPVGELTFQ